MSEELFVQSIINDAAMLHSDPAQTNIKPPAWLSMYNYVVREFAAALPAYEVFSDFDVTTNLEYRWPNNMIQCRGIWMSSTPDLPDSFTALFEMGDDDYINATRGSIPQIDVPVRYCPRAGRWHQYPNALAEIPNGGIMAYTAIPPDATNPTLDTFPFPDFVRNPITNLLRILAKLTSNQLAEAGALENYISALAPDVREKLEDRSDDRRAALRLGFSSIEGRRMV